MADKPRVRGNRRFDKTFIEECKSATITVQVDMSPTMARIYRSFYDSLSRAAFLLRFYCRVGMSQKDEDKIVERLLNHTHAANEGLLKKLTVANERLAACGIQAGQGRLDTITVTVIDPIAHHFIRVLRNAQALETSLNGLWLSCEITDLQRNLAIIDIQNELRSIHTRVREEYVAVRTLARKETPKAPEPALTLDAPKTKARDTSSAQGEGPASESKPDGVEQAA